MNRRSRNVIIFVALGLLLVLAGLVFLSRLFQQQSTPAQFSTPEAALTQQVVVTTHDLPSGALLLANDLMLVEMPIEFVPRNALTQVDSALGRITKFQLVSGEMVLQHHLADPTNVNQDLAFILSDDHVLLAFPANDLMSRNSIIQRGDIVDIFVSLETDADVVESGTFGTIEEEKIKTLFTFDALQRTSITAMVISVVADDQQQSSTFSSGPGTTGEEGAAGQAPARENIDIQAYLLALDPQDALVLKFLLDAGGLFDLALRSPTSTQVFDLDPVSAEFIKELYGLEILR